MSAPQREAQPRSWRPDPGREARVRSAARSALYGARITLALEAVEALAAGDREAAGRLLREAAAIHRRIEEHDQAGRDRLVAQAQAIVIPTSAAMSWAAIERIEAEHDRIGSKAERGHE